MSSSHASPSQAAGWPLLRLGFRPFYLLAALAGVLLMPLWWLVFTGRLQPAGGLAPSLWHGHELLFGMFAAVIVGFLFTAGKAWTGLQTPRGASLGLLALLWLAARVTSITGPYPLFLLLDLIFLPLAAAVFAGLLIKARNYRNLGIAGVLALLGLANLMFHLGISGAGGLGSLSAQRALQDALALVILLETLIGGRVIPMFTRNATPGLDTSVPVWRERTLLLVTVAALLLWLSGSAPVLTALVLTLAAAVHLWRLQAWKPWSTRGRPILWILHLAYAWIPAGFALLALSMFLPQAHSPGLHALAVGAGAGLIVAMITRTARGHTGRPLQASSSEAWAYRLILLAAVVRVFGPLLLPAFYLQALVLAGLLFAASFLLYLCRYAWWLMSPRADGRDD